MFTPEQRHKTYECSMNGDLQYIVLLFPILGTGLFIGDLVYYLRLKHKVAHYQETPGTVVDHVVARVDGFEISPAHYPVAEYFVDNTRYTITSETGYRRPQKTGMKLNVRFNPGNPSSAFLAADYYIFAHMLLVIGGSFMLLGSYLAYKLIF